ncbi:uncharacterized protein LOC134288119 [Aedes albopictus]|uniref:Uncharacterized protein n=1 Tax=Aedes albopictus TaxID=7160 RepID=A0ABM1YKC5_AEDAL
MSSESCRGLISHNRSPNTKKRRSDGNDETMQPSFSGQQHHDVPEPEPSTSGQQIEHELDMVPSPSIPSLESIPSTDQLQGPHNIEKFNTIAETLSLSPISSKNMRSMEYRINKSLQITKAVRKNIFGIDSTDVGKVEAYDEIIMQLKDKFNHPTDRSEQIKILSVLPKSWSVNKITREFNAPMYMARQVKELVYEQGILCTTKKRGNGIDDDTKQIVREFFDDNDISRPMPGTNDFVSEVRNGKKQQVQKRLLMMSLKEAYMIFVDTLPFNSLGSPPQKHVIFLGPYLRQFASDFKTLGFIQKIICQRNFEHDLKETFSKKIVCKLNLKLPNFLKNEYKLTAVSLEVGSTKF